MAADYDTLRDFFQGRLIRSGECWVFTGSKSHGYGLVQVEPRGRGHSGRRRVAHRVAYESFVAKVPHSLVLDHLCRNRACVNPSHLRVCSQRENILAPGSLSLPAAKLASRHCVNGHLFPAKTNSKGWRVCPVCRKEIRRRYLAKVSARASGVNA